MNEQFWQGKRVLVTGGAGFIGAALTKRLRQQDAVVSRLDLNNEAWTDVYLVSVTNFSALDNLFNIVKPQVVFHLAAETEVLRSYKEPWNTWHTNLLGTLNVLECCRQHKVESVVIASTDKAYGNWNDACAEDWNLCHNADPYSSSKRAADELAQDYLRWFDMPVKIIRCANTYGPRQTNGTTLITNTVNRLLRGEEPVIHAGRERVKREWLYIDDAVDAYLRLAESQLTGPFNVGSGERYSTEQVVEKIKDALFFANLPLIGMALPPRNTQIDVTPLQIGDQGLDSTKLRTAFPDWQTTSFSEGLRRTIAWHKEQVK